MYPFMKRINQLRILFFGSRNPLSGLSNRLKILAESLDATCKSVEPEFLRLIQELQSVYSDASELTQQVLETVNLIGGDSGEGVLSNVESLAKGSLAQLNHCKDEVTANLRRLEAIDRHLGNLSGLCEMIKKIGRFLRVVGLNMDIESARSTESREMFRAVSTDTKKLAGRLIALAESIREDTQSVRSIQIGAHVEISKNMNHLIEITDDADHAVQKLVREIEQFIGRSLEVMEEAGTHAREISRQIGEMVVGIQLYDSMTQRIEHIVKTLADAERLCAEAASANESGMSRSAGPEEETLNSAHAIVNLQAEQIRRVISEVEELYEKGMQAFGRIGKEVSSLAHCLSFIKSQNIEVAPAGEGAGEDLFKALQSALGRLHLLLEQVLEQGDSLLDRVRMAEEAACEAAARISDHTADVRGISLQTHFLALNAIVKSAHIGEKGRTFDVLSQEVKSLSDQSIEFITNAEEILVSITTESQEMKSRQGADASDLYSRESVSLESGIHDVSMAYERFTERSADVSQRAGVLREEISKIHAGLDFIPALAEALREELCQLEEIVQILRPWAGLNDVVSRDRLDQLTERYTMHKERDIHEKVISDGSYDATHTSLEGLEQGDGEYEREVVFFETDDEMTPGVMEKKIAEIVRTREDKGVSGNSTCAAQELRQIDPSYLNASEKTMKDNVVFFFDTKKEHVDEIEDDSVEFF